MSADTGIAVGGLVIGVLGLIAAGVAPKVPPGNEGDPAAWITPDDYSVQPWTAVMFLGGLALALAVLGAGGIHDTWGVPLWLAFAGIGLGLAALVGWGFAVRRLARRRTG
jgi:hypothetical protein